MKFLEKTLLSIIPISLILILFNYDYVWSHPENLIKEYILHRGRSANTTQFPKIIFDWSLWENGAPRTTRLGSSLLDFLDFEFRTLLWQYITPHPSLSISWGFVFLTAFFIHKSFVKLGFSIRNALFGSLCFLLTPGPLSLLVMHFRVGKSAALLLTAIIFYLVIKYRKTNNPIVYFSILAITFVSLFFDEISFLNIFILIFFALDNAKNRIRHFLLVLLPFLFYFLFIQFFIDKLYNYFGYPILCNETHCLNNKYKLQQKFVDQIFTTDLDSLIKILYHFQKNVFIILGDILGYSPLISPNLNLITLISLLSLTSFIILFIILLSNSSRSSAPILLFSFLFLLVAMMFHSLLMSTTNHPLWGIYWYGVFICFPFILVICSIYDFIGKKNNNLFNNLVLFNKFFLVFFLILNFQFTNNIYRYLHYYPNVAPSISEYFQYNLNRYEFTENFDYDTKSELKSLQNISNSDTLSLSLESAFVLNETNYCLGEDNYYYLSPIDFNFYFIDALEAPYKLEVLCFENFVRQSSLVKSPENRDKLLNDLVGFYTDGIRKSFITYNPTNSRFYVVNSSGEDSEILIFGSRVYAKMWKLYGNLDINNSSIEWDNGSVYFKLSK